MNHACGCRCRIVRYYFFLSFEEVLVLLVDDVLEGVVFLADSGFEARCRLDAAGLAAAAAVFFVAAALDAVLLTALDRGSVFSDALAGTGPADSAGGGFLAASRQFG